MSAKVRYINTAPGRNGKRFYYCRLTGVALPSPDDEAAFLTAVLAARAHLGPNPTPASARLARQAAAAKAASEAPKEDRSFRRLVADYKTGEDYTRLGVRTRKEYDRHIARLLDGLGPHQVAAIRTEHVKKIMGKFSGTVGKAVKRVLSAILSHAVEESWIQTNPAFGLEKKRRNRRTVDEHGDRVEAGQRPLEEAGIARVRRCNPVGTRPRAIFECLLATGFRRGDSRRMPSDLADRTTIPLVTNKSGQVVIAPVTDEMRKSALAWNQARMRSSRRPISSSARRQTCPS